MKRFVAVAAFGAALIVPSGGLALADPSPNGPGQPGAPGTTCFSSTSTMNSPGGSTTQNNSSVFNGSGEASEHYAGNTGTASAANAQSSNAVSQYDIACFQVTPGH
jgi:hypothetical protein